ncbi:MAG: NAD-dependent epimerase/dehydratase family protein [Myxococcales bacterium]|nr:NAD-dependent epimerase/dehydratase family protein [Myxococcales bacterium]
MMGVGSSVGTAGRGLETRRAPREGRSVAVTGANTFLGRNLVGLLEEDPTVARIVVLDVKNPASAGAKTCFYDTDLTAPGVDSTIAEILHAEAVDTVVHLAFVASPTQAVAWAHELESAGTMHLLAACRKHALRKLVVRSNVLVYGAHPSNPNFLTEEHPLLGLPGSHFVEDKVDVEQQVRSFSEERPDCCVTVLRMGAILGPTVHNYVVRWLSHRFVPRLMGHDPLTQFLHEVDAVAALKLALERDARGALNIVGDGVLPISTVIKLVGRLSLPIPAPIFRRFASLLWVAQLSEAPPSFLAALRYLCVADGSRAYQRLGFKPVYSSRDAVLDFEGALRLRDARLLQEVG